MRNHQVMNQSKFTWNAFGNFQHISSTEGKNIRHLQSSAAVSSWVLSAPKVAKESYVQSCKSHHETQTFNKLLASSTLWAGSARVERNNSTPTSKFSALVTSLSIHDDDYDLAESCTFFPPGFGVECAARQSPCPRAVLAGCGYYVGHPAKLPICKTHPSSREFNEIWWARFVALSRFDALCQFQVQITRYFQSAHQHVVFIFIFRKKNDDFTTQYLLF